MFAIICRRRPTWVLPKDSILRGPQLFDPRIAVFVRSLSSKKSPPGVCIIDSEKSLTVSYLVNSCGLSFEDALSASKKVCIKSPKKSDAVLKLLKEYGFTDAHILRLVNRWPIVLNLKPKKNLLPKLEFFYSIGSPPSIVAEKVSIQPRILRSSLNNTIIPWYNTLKSVLRSDKRVTDVLFRGVKTFCPISSKLFLSIPSKIALLRERGLPESSIASLLSLAPKLMIISKEKLAACVDRAVEMGFDKEKIVFCHALQLFANMSESKLRQKIDVYRRCGWTESDINTAFLKFPLCMAHSEKKITGIMDFLVNKIGLNPADVAQWPSLLCYSLDKRMKPRYLVARILNVNGKKEMVSIISLLTMSEKKFLKSHIVDYQDDIPELLDIYRGKLRLNEMGFSQDVIETIQFDFKHDDADR